MPPSHDPARPAASRWTRVFTPDRRRGYPILFFAIFGALWLVRVFLIADEYGVLRANFADDFLGFYTGGRFLLEGRTDELYNLAAQASLQHGAVDGFEASMTAFISPPFAVFLYAPFSWTVPSLGLALWLAFGCAALYASARILQRGLPGFSDLAPGLLVWRGVLFPPVAFWFLTGQATMFILLHWTAHYALLRARRDFWAGVVLGLLLWKPQLGLGPALVLVAARRWRALAGGVVGAGGWLLLGFLTMPGAMVDFAHSARELTAIIRGENYHSWGLASLYGFGTLLLDGLSPVLGGALGWALTLGGLAWIVALFAPSGWEPGSRAWNLRYAAASALSALVGLHLFFYDLSLLLLPLAIVWGESRAACGLGAGAGGANRVPALGPEKESPGLLGSGKNSLQTKNNREDESPGVRESDENLSGVRGSREENSPGVLGSSELHAESCSLAENRTQKAAREQESAREKPLGSTNAQEKSRSLAENLMQNPAREQESARRKPLGSTNIIGFFRFPAGEADFVERPAPDGVWVGGLLGMYSSLATASVLGWLGWPRVIVQWVVLLVLWWVWQAAREARASEEAPEA